MIIVGLLLGIASYILYYVFARGGYDIADIYRYGRYFSLALLFRGIGGVWVNRVEKYLLFYNASFFWLFIFLIYVGRSIWGSALKEGASILSVNGNSLFLVLTISTIIQLCLLLFYFSNKPK